MKTLNPILLFFVFAYSIIFVSCNGEEESYPEAVFNVTDMQLIEKGEILDKSDIDIHQQGTDTVSFLIRTVYVMKGDKLNDVMVSTIYDDLYVKIMTKPYNNPNWHDTDNLKEVHDVKFNVVGLKKGAYNLNITINNVTINKNNYIID